MKARKKPVEVEVKLFRDLESAEDIEIWAHKKAYYYVENHVPLLMIETLEGKMIANVGDYIIKGVHGEIYSCKPDIFHKTYELLEEE